MLKILRKKGVMKRIIWAIVIMIVVAFGFGGTLYLLNDLNKGAYAGKIFHQRVSRDQFRKAYRNTRIQALLRYGSDFQQVRQYLDLEAETWDRLILLHEAKKERVRVSDQDVIETIQAYPFFQKNGQFDNTLYQLLLQRVFRVPPRIFEESVRENLVLRRLLQNKTADIAVSEAEAWDVYKRQNEKVQVSYVLIKPDDTSQDATIPESALKKYYEENKLDFLSPLAVNVRYILVPFAENVEKTTPPSPPSEEAKNAARQKAETITEELQAQPDLAAVASKHGLTVKTSGFFDQEHPNLSLGWPYPVLHEVFRMDPEDISPPLETPGGYVLIQVMQKKEARIPAFEEVKDKVREAILRKKARAQARQKAEQVLEALKKEMAKTKLPDFAKAAKALGLDLQQTPAFSRGQYLPKIGIAKDFQEEAFRLNEGELSPVVETEKGFCILHLDQSIPADPEAFQKKKDEIMEAIREEKINQFINNFLTELRAKAQLESYLQPPNES